MQIEKTFREFDAKKLASIYESLDQTKKQISFSSRGNITDMQDGVGSIFDYQPAVEWDWDHINPIFKGTYLETVYNTLAKDYKLGRARFMRMDKNNRALKNPCVIK